MKRGERVPGEARAPIPGVRVLDLDPGGEGTGHGGDAAGEAGRIGQEAVEGGVRNDLQEKRGFGEVESN